MKKIIRNALIGIGVLVLVIIGFLVWVSPQKTMLFVDKNGQVLPNSIAEIIDIEINGVKQRLLIRGKDKSNPVLLHVHGGPGFPDYAFFKEADANIEDLFTVCYWEQRGSAASFADNILHNTMTLSQIVNDGEWLSRYLIKRFNKQKIYLQGHSWGTAVGSFLAQQNPELFHAYIGIGQTANPQLSEQISYDFALAESKKANYQAGIDILEKMGRPPYKTEAEWLKNVLPERTIMRKFENPYGKAPKTMVDFYKTFILHREYSIADKLKIAKGENFSMKHLWMQNKSLNLFESIPEQTIPVYILQGKYDKHTCTDVAKSYFDYLQAPFKKYYEFEKSGHDPHLEEFDRYRKMLLEILGN